MTRRIGVELELLAPPRTSRRRLADKLAAATSGTVTMSWHHDSDRTQHPEFGSFRHLTPAFDVTDSAGSPLVRIADDVTIVSDLDRTAAPARHWRRVLAGDRVWLDRLRPFLAPLAPLDAGVEAAGAEHGLTIERRGGTFRFNDPAGALVALVTGVPGERPRVAECISPPLTGGVQSWFELVAGVAADLGFTLPAEGATHLHYDAEPFRNPDAFRRLVRTFGGDLGPMRERFATNGNCRGIGVLDAKLVDLVNDPAYETLPWPQIVARAQATGSLTKYCDVNLQHLLAEVPRIDTVEFRMLPSTLDSSQFADLLSGVEELVDSIVGPVQPG